MRHNQVTAKLCTCRKNGRYAVALYFVFKVHFPADSAELVATTERVSLHLGIIIVKLAVTDIARIFILFCCGVINFWIFFFDFFVIFNTYLENFVVGHGKPLVFQLFKVPFKVAQN